jgi:hypothetical protein
VRWTMANTTTWDAARRQAADVPAAVPGPVLALNSEPSERPG